MVLNYGTVKAKRPILDGIQFDSKLECDFYRKLRDYPGVENISVHSKTLLLPAATPYGRLNWRVDFSFEYRDRGYLLEIKGIINDKIRMNLQMLNIFNAEHFEGIAVGIDLLRIGKKHRASQGNLANKLKVPLIRYATFHLDIAEFLATSKGFSLPNKQLALPAKS